MNDHYDPYAAWTDEEVLRAVYQESTNPLVQTLTKRLAAKIDELDELRDRSKRLAAKIAELRSLK